MYHTTRKHTYLRLNFGYACGLNLTAVGAIAIKLQCYTQVGRWAPFGVWLIEVPPPQVGLTGIPPLRGTLKNGCFKAANRLTTRVKLCCARAAKGSTADCNITSREAVEVSWTKIWSREFFSNFANVFEANYKNPQKITWRWREIPPVKFYGEFS